jgi:mannitol operon repressor
MKKPTQKEIKAFNEIKACLDAMSKESARGLVLTAVAMIEDLLGQSIRSFLVGGKATDKLMEGSLSSLSARLLAASALGLVSEIEYRDCEIMRKIRNEFAHSVHVSFDDTKIRDLCTNLKLCASDYLEARESARKRYIMAAITLILNLTNRPNHVATHRLHYRPWPLNPTL